MQQLKKVSKYLGTQNEAKPEPLADTLPPGMASKAANASTAKPKGHVPEEDPLLLQSLTPVNVLEKIRNDIVTVLGIQRGIGGKFTKLEQKLIDYLEKIVRKGQCPSILVRESDLIAAMLCLRKYFETDSVGITPDGSATKINIPVFPALYKYAKDAAFCEQRMRELRGQKNRCTNPVEKNAFESELRQLKERRDNCLIYYQKIIFTDAELQARKGQKRTISLYGKAVSIDDLLAFLKKGGRLDQARREAPPRSTKPAPERLSSTDISSTSLSLEQEGLEDTLGSFDRTDAMDDVVDWRQIKSKKRGKDGEKKGYSFNI